ncbi:MAG: hypothetical protein SOU18_05300, partial [Alloprevotella sp.]|nr:hypothetical protein [Alloprevotella sp.]
ENIKDIKSFRAKKFGFNISGNYSGGFIIANCAGKKCTAPCLQGVSTEFVLNGDGTLHLQTNSSNSLSHTLQATCGTLPSQ